MPDPVRQPSYSTVQWQLYMPTCPTHKVNMKDTHGAQMEYVWVPPCSGVRGMYVLTAIHNVYMYKYLPPIHNSFRRTTYCLFFLLCTPHTQHTLYIYIPKCTAVHSCNSCCSRVEPAQWFKCGTCVVHKWLCKVVSGWYCIYMYVCTNRQHVQMYM